MYVLQVKKDREVVDVEDGWIVVVVKIGRKKIMDDFGIVVGVVLVEVVEDCGNKKCKKKENFVFDFYRF